MRWSITGDKEIVEGLRRLSQVEYEAVVKLNMTEIYNRGKRPGGTPFRTGQLRQSLGLTKAVDNAYDVGYKAEYAPFVEYGHRTKSGTYIRGQHFLRNNVETQRPRLKQDIIDRLRKAGG